MRIEIRSDSVILDGYVNVVGRDSKLIPSIKGKFREQIEPGAFKRALKNASNVDLLLNHDKKKKLGSTTDKNLELFEDNIGLRGICTVTDTDVIKKAKNNQLRGWSFGFFAEEDSWEETREEGIQRRKVKELSITEVSILDNTKMPAYFGTSIEQREEKDIVTETRGQDFKAVIDDISITEKEKEQKRDIVDNSLYLKKIELLKLKTLR